MAKIIADRLGGEVDVVLVHKLGAPGNPEYAIGAVDEWGHVLLNEDAGFTVDDPYVEQEAQGQLKTLQLRRRQYTPIRSPIDPKGRIVIIIDDGIATGSTMLAALRAVRRAQPKKLITATAVAPADSLSNIAAEADEVVCLETPSWFSAVAQFFTEFPQVSDEEVIMILAGGGSTQPP
jgi:predicted phosphoribosyltransferase